MTKREFIEQTAMRVRVGMMDFCGDGTSKTNASVDIAEDLWNEIEKRYGPTNLMPLEVPT